MDKETPSTPILPNLSAKKRTAAKGNPLLVVAIYSWTLPIVILVTFLIGFLLGYFMRTSTTSVQAFRPTPVEDQNALAQNENQRGQIMKLIASQTNHYIGNQQAPVQMYEFSDFRCPYCAKYNLETGKRIFSKYVEQGKVYLGFVHLAILGEESVQAALASECAAEQQKFWEYHELLFAQREGGKNPDYSTENLIALAQELKLDVPSFSECLKSGRYTSSVLQQTQFARQLGLSSTPSFVINGKVIIGAQAYEVFEGIIEEELNQKTQ